MKLIVGLGNPDKKYNKTRHNIGFMVLDNFLSNKEFKKDGKALLFHDQGSQTIFLKPLTYMNLSGTEVSRIVNYYKIKSEDVMVIQDDIDLPLGEYRLKFNSGTGGHNGIKSVADYLLTSNFARLKIGINRIGCKENVAKYVLEKFNAEETKKITEVFNITNQIIKDYQLNDIFWLMNKYNGS